MKTAPSTPYFKTSTVLSCKSKKAQMRKSAFNFFISATLSQLAALKAGVSPRQMDAIKVCGKIVIGRWKRFKKTKLGLTFRAKTVLCLNSVVCCGVIDATTL